MRDASVEIENLRGQIPGQYKLARDLKYPTQLSNTLALSTFHGCPADEIERICEFLITKRDLDVIVKINPPMLGKERLEHLLHDELGYTELTVNPSAYTPDCYSTKPCSLSWPDAAGSRSGPQSSAANSATRWKC